MAIVETIPDYFDGTYVFENNEASAVSITIDEETKGFDLILNRTVGERFQHSF